MPESPISPTSPWYHFSREGIGSLARREWMGETICAEDVERVVAANPDAESDERLGDFIARVAYGEIEPRPVRKGRPSGRIARYFFVFEHYYQTRLAEIREKQACGEYPKPLPSLLSPCEQAAEDVARRYKLAGGRNFSNQRSIEIGKIREHVERSHTFFVKERERHS